MSKTLDEIRHNWDNGHYVCHMDIPNKLPETYIFDENLTIKENRERIWQHNQKVVEMKREKQNKNAELSRQLTIDVVDYIVENYELNRGQAAIVESYVYTEKHSFMCDYFSNIDSVAAMAEAIITAKN